MKLTRLELSGFKSFADTVELTFDEGITAVVGPNGCGKSNVSDAVRWVLGEQRARILRGAKMEDIIFQGTTKRKPVNVAEISLHFDNSDGVLPVSYREVVITRRLSRNGQSDYLLNQQPVRLKDVQDLLRGTGLGSDGGVVIEAQQIDRLLSDRTDERRALFEEAAGIGLYRDRKTTTERRLDKTLEDLQRLDDVISEVQTQVRSLARQRGKADRHQTLTADRFGIVMTLTRRSLQALDERNKGIGERRDQINISLPEARTKVEELERERESRVQKRASAEAQRAGLLRQLAERQEESGKLEGDLTVATERLTNASSRVTRARDETAHAKRRSEQASREREAAQEELKAAIEAKASVQTELDLREAGEQETKDRLANQRGTCRKLENELQETAERFRSLSGEREALDRDVGDLTAQESELRERSDTAKATLEEASQRLADAERLLAERNQAHKTATAELEKARHTLAAAKETEAAVIAERRAVEERLLQTEARKEVLEALERDRAGLAPAAKELLENQDKFAQGAILGPLSDFLRPTAAGAESVAQVLSDWVHAVLVADQAAVEAVKQWHAKANPGPLVLLPVNPGPASPGTPDEAFKVEIKKPAKEWADALLAGHISLGENDSRAIQRPNGAIFLPGEKDKRGPLHRRAELDELAKAIDELSGKAAEIERRVHKAEDELSAATTSVEEATANEETSRQALRESTGAHADAERDHQRNQREDKEIGSTFERVQERLTNGATRLQEVEEELKSLTRLRTETEAELERQRTVLRRLDAEQDAAREHRVHWQVEEAQVTAREEAAREREARADKVLQTAVEEIERLEKELSGIDTSTSEAEKNKADWTDRLKELRTEINELQAAATQAETEMSESQEALEKAQVQLAAERERGTQLTEEVHHIEIEQTEAAGRRNALVERIEAEWRKPLDVLLEAAPEVEGNDSELQEEGDQLAAALEAMGPVNPLAAPEHDEEKKRLEFLETQREDLVDARTSLLEALKEIDETARQLFQETFASIRENFRKVFLTLFEVGECDVRLSDESDPLGCDIDIRAAPRGKRTQRIHLLSSGERALVAISLLFAIYLAKPSPFCLLDEVDAPLDDSNVQRFLRLLDEFKADTQFIVITHNPRTMQTADAVYGVTMQEPGVSSIVGVRLGEGAIA